MVNQNQFILVVVIMFVSGMSAMIYWFVSLGPRRAVSKLRSTSPGSDHDRLGLGAPEAHWNTYRILLREGLKTVWDLQTSAGQSVGSIEIAPYLNVPGKGHPLTINGKLFQFRKNMVGFGQDGFRVLHQNQEYFLRGDRDFGTWNTFRSGFRNLILCDSPSAIKVQSLGDRRLGLFRDSTLIGVASHRDGFFPGRAAFDPEASLLERACLFYCRLF